MMAEFRKRQTTHRFHVERFNLKKLDEAKGKEHYRVRNRFASLENLDQKGILIMILILLDRISKFQIK
jgi:hypothetical protein